MGNNKVLIAVVAAVVMLAVVFVPLAPAPASAAPDMLKQTQYMTLLNANGVTSSQTGAKMSSLKYTTGDCYSVVDVTSQQTVTVKFQHSGDGTNYVDLASLSSVSSDGTSFTHTLVYGTYIRAVATLGTTNPVTVTAHCVLKD